MNRPKQTYSDAPPAHVSRRWFIEQCGVGMGALALNHLLSSAGYAQTAANPLAPKKTHHAPKAKNVIFLFMAGAPSHLEMFDNKPQLAKFNGTLPPPDLLKGYRAAFINPNSKLLGPKFKFAKHGQAGAELSELLPLTPQIVDDIAIVKSMATDAFNHAPAQLMMNTGSMGSEATDLPAYVVFSTGRKGPSGGNSNWGSGFLPTVYSGVQFRNVGDPVLYLSNPKGVDEKLQRDSLDTINKLNRMRLDTVGDPEIATRINSFEMAFKMQSVAPDVLDLNKEPKHILEMYGAEPGKPSYANSVLMARRLVERGVRFVQIYHEAWDQHGSLVKDIKQNCLDTEQASVALIKDLKQRGMLKDTLVIWGGEFGRTPMVQGGTDDGRDHHPNAFTMWMAGGGIKAGITLGETDELGFNVVKDRVHVHDLHATLLHLLGFEHEKLTYRFQGRDFRLTDVHGLVVDKLLA
jgi:hypothetical protein